MINFYNKNYLEEPFMAMPLKPIKDLIPMLIRKAVLGTFQEESLFE